MSTLRGQFIGGYSYAGWHCAELRDALRHLGRRSRSKNSKPDLWAALRSAIEDRRLSEPACAQLAETYVRHATARREHIRQARNARSRAAAAQQSDGHDPNPFGSIAPTANSPVEEPFDCVICTETLGINERPERPEGSGCAHENSACRQCLAQSISAQLSNKSWDALQCPSCQSSYGYNEIKAFADPAVFAR